MEWVWLAGGEGDSWVLPEEDCEEMVGGSSEEMVGGSSEELVGVGWVLLTGDLWFEVSPG